MIGLHVNVLQGQHLEAIRAMRPAANLLLDPRPESAGALKAAYPDALLIGRPYIPDSEVHGWYLNGDPSEAGRRAAGICLAHHRANPMVDAWLLINEPPVATMEQLIKLAAFDSAFAKDMRQGGSRGCIGAFARGTPQIPALDGGAALRAYMPALRVAEEVGALVAFHQYGFNPLFKDAEWNALRWQVHILPWLAQQGLSRFEYIVSEVGCDLGTGRVENGTVVDGWKHAFGDTPEGREAYADQLLMLMREYAKDSRCKGATLFCAGNQNRWGSFDVAGEMLSRLMAIQWPPIASAPTPPVVPPTPIPPKPEAPTMPTLSQILSAKMGNRFKDVRADMPTGAGVYSYVDSRKMTYIALHYSTGLPGPVSPLNIARDHAKPVAQGGRGWPGIGYHFVVDEGVAYYVGSADTQRAHVANRNDEALGICFTGLYDTTLPSPADTEVARLLIAGLDEFYGHKKQLVGHKQLMAQGHTNCPGRILELIPALRAPVPTPKPPRAPLPEDEIIYVERGDLKTFLQKAVYWQEEYIRELAAKRYARAGTIRLSLAKLLTAGRDKWNT